MQINAARNHRSSYDRRHDVELVAPLGVQFDELAAIDDRMSDLAAKLEATANQNQLRAMAFPPDIDDRNDEKKTRIFGG